ncbi:MAG: hypothetical protein QG597_4724 [Actinomycetota bacterium]|nr:hypothetical protein [Actinomycetota bacterium]
MAARKTRATSRKTTGKTRSGGGGPVRRFRRRKRAAQGFWRALVGLFTAVRDARREMSRDEPTRTAARKRTRTVSRTRAPRAGAGGRAAWEPAPSQMIDPTWAGTEWPPPAGTQTDEDTDRFGQPLDPEDDNDPEEVNDPDDPGAVDEDPSGAAAGAV